MSKAHDQFIADIVGLFCDGMNTADVADFLDCHESIVTRTLHIGLERRRSDRQPDELARAMVRLADELGANV
jgi:hypothetical protein